MSRLLAFFRFEVAVAEAADDLLEAEFADEQAVDMFDNRHMDLVAAG